MGLDLYIMAHFDFRSPDYFVEVTTGIRINHVDYALEGDKVMDADLHIYTVDLKNKRIERGPDYFIWDTGIAVFEEWSQRLNTTDEWDDETPQYLRIEGKTYKINHADRSWPLPELYYNAELKGHITTETDETGATERIVKWL